MYQEYRDRGLDVVAVNILTGYSLGEWMEWWQQYTKLPVVWAQDTRNNNAATSFRVTSLGYKVLIDREGRIARVSAGAEGYTALKGAVEAALR